MLSVLKAMLTTGSASVACMLLGAITTKVIAVLAGPSGIAVFAQLRQAAQWLITLATLNGQTSLIRGAASKEGEEKLRFISTVAMIYLFASLIVVLAAYAGGSNIARFLFDSSDERFIRAVSMLPVIIAVGSVSSFVYGVINSYREIKTLALIQISGSVATVAIVYPLLHFWNHPAAYIIIVSIGFLVSSVVGIWWIVRRRWFAAIAWSRLAKANSLYTREHISYSIATLAAGLVGAGAVLYIRSLYIQTGGLDAGGVFDAAWTISMMYVMLLLSSFNTYYFPTLSGTKSPENIQELVTRVFRIATLVGTLLVSFVVIAKPLLVSLLYSGGFHHSTEILRWMLIGDYFKITTWVLGMLLLAFAERLRFITCELVYHSLMVGSIYLLISSTWEIAGIVFMIYNALYLAYIWRHAYRKYGVRIDKPLVYHWLLGLLVVLASSAFAWNEVSMNVLNSVLLWCVTSFLFLLLATSVAERRSAIVWMRNRILHD